MAGRDRAQHLRALSAALDLRHQDRLQTSEAGCCGVRGGPVRAGGRARLSSLWSARTELPGDRRSPLRRGARPDDGRGSTRGRDAFRAACSECRVVPARDELTQAVTGLLDFWWWISVGGAMVRSHPNSTVVPVQQIQRAIVRKAWMTLLAWDRVSAAPVRTCQFVRAARIAVECGIAPALQALRDGQADPDDLLGGTGEMALVGDAPTLSLDWSETVSRRQRTMELLAGDKDTAAAIGARAPEWERAYLRLVAGCGRSLEEFLSPAELVEYLDEMGF